MNIKNCSYVGNKLNVDDVVIRNGDNTYDFYFTHKNYQGGFIYYLHRDLRDGINGSNNKYVGTFRHPYGSNRQDVYESDLLDKTSFLYFLDTLVNDWAVMHKQ
jgi:hypothetical protein